MKAALAPVMAKLAVALYGRPTARLRHELRFRRKGSLGIVIAGPKAGSWFDFEVGEGGDVFGLIMRARGLSFAEAKAFAVDFIGGSIPLDVAPPEPDIVLDQHDPVRIAEALALWGAAVDPRGTIVESYLAGRKAPLTDRAAGDAIRFHPALWFEGRRVPGMVALMRDVITNEACGVHRTFLSPDGSKLAKRMMGRAKGAAIKLTPDEDVTVALAIGEGIETSLSADMLGFGPTWVAGNSGAIGTFPVLTGIEVLRILVETDDKGANPKAAEACARRWYDAGREVRLVIPRLDGDMNNVACKVA
ncbi:hypothetical protein CCR97_09135 [Rhodoplanes elegans]|uniref:Uncharacterized protein n=1 Tax=Rhodoplanes elegans TaxID=29408 RepID=A0A327K1Z7_9BRAD|nr:hypothetical protein [Rhodoplanes elegans]RAI32457.1 hypothetical protein CH338_24115 [Rhodoplanes elegans]